MIMRTIPLHESVSVTFDVNGNGTGMLGPSVYGQSWNITLITTSCTTPNTQQVTFQVYRNFAAPGQNIGGSYSGQNDSDDISVMLMYGERLVFTWTGGNSGDQGTAVVMGTLSDVRT